MHPTTVAAQGFISTVQPSGKAKGTGGHRPSLEGGFLKFHRVCFLPVGPDVIPGLPPLPRKLRNGLLLWQPRAQTRFWGCVAEGEGRCCELISSLCHGLAIGTPTMLCSPSPRKTPHPRPALSPYVRDMLSLLCHRKDSS